MELLYRRPPDREERFRQELLLARPGLAVTLQVLPEDADPRPLCGDVTLRPGSSLLWFTFPDRPYEVAAVHDPDGRLLGHYTNVIRPPVMEPDPGEHRGGQAFHRWEITDLFLDLWQPVDGTLLVLDREEFEEAVRKGWLEPGEAKEAERTCRELEARARAGRWPPRPVRRWTPDRVPALRMRRDEPGLYHANLVAARIVATGLYLLGAVSLTSLLFGAATDALQRPGPARTGWLGLLAVEAVALLAAGLAGRLPATRRVRLREVMTEQTLFLAAGVSALAVLLVSRDAFWRSLLSAVYGTLAGFSALFAVCRAWFDRRLPGAALGGLAVALAALWVLLG